MQLAFDRNDTIPLLYKPNNINTSSNLNNQLINKWISSTKKFAKTNPNIMFTKADKGNITVVLDKDYILKVENMLSNENTYSNINKNPINKMTTDLRSFLTRWKRSEFIDQHI